MKILILGAGGMAGHALSRYLASRPGLSVVPVCRELTGLESIDSKAQIVDLRDRSKIQSLLESQRPCMVVNAAIVLPDSAAPREDRVWINSELPHFVAQELDRNSDGSRLVQVSSDGVFSGRTGQYTEASPPDPVDEYGQEKLRGEVSHGVHLSIRTSLIGYELKRKRGLLEWFLAQRSTVKGFRRVIWSGVTTLEFARFVAYTLENSISGLVHCSSGRMSKYELLKAIAAEYGLQTEIIPDDAVVSDRSLLSIRKDCSFKVSSVASMLQELRRWGRVKK